MARPARHGVLHAEPGEHVDHAVVEANLLYLVQLHCFLNDNYKIQFDAIELTKSDYDNAFEYVNKITEKRKFRETIPQTGLILMILIPILN